MGTHPIFESDFDCLTEMFSRFAGQATRSFVRPPVQVYGLSGSYASATYSAAVKSDSLADVASDMVTIGQVFENSKISDFFADPFISKSAKMEAIEAVDGLSDITVNLFGAMAENNRLGLVGDVAEVYARIVKATQGSVPCSVESAIPLTAEQEGDVAGAIAGLLKAGESADISVSVNPELLGGMIVSVVDKYTEMKSIDMSVLTKVKKYTEMLHRSS